VSDCERKIDTELGACTLIIELVMEVGITIGEPIVRTEEHTYKLE
jgi:hypothetical protein